MMLHKSDMFHWPKKSYDYYKEDNLLVVQAVRTLKFWIAFKIGDANMVYWCDSFELSTLSKIRDLRSKLYNMYLGSVARIPCDVFPER